MKFTAAEDAVVTIAGDNGLLSAASVEITGTGADQYVAINPVEATLSYSIGGVQCKEVHLTFAAKNIYNLGFLGGMVSLSPGIWDGYGAWFAARFYNGGTQAAAVNALTRAGEEVDEAWVKMTDNDYDGVYECLVPGAYTNVIFCRMADTATEADFGTWEGVVWNQSADLTIDDECYAVTDWDAGKWGEKPAAPTYGVVGTFNGWDATKAVAMTLESDYWYVARGVELYKDDAFKIVKNNSWDVSYGVEGNAAVVELNTPTQLTSSYGNNIIPATNGEFDIYFSVKTHEMKYVCVEENTALTIDITIDNQAGWNPLFITLKSGSTTVVNKATVSNNKVSVSGSYIGEALTYELSTSSNGDPVTGEVTLTKTGASIVLPEQTGEEVVKNMLYLNANFWDPNSARFAAYFFGNGEKWVSMTAVSGKSGVYEVEVPAGFETKNVIFCRMNKSTSANNWNNKWNQTGDLSVNGNIGKIFTVNAWDGQTTGWGAYN